MSRKLGFFVVSILFASLLQAKSNPPAFLKDFPPKAFYKLSSGNQVVGRTEFSWQMGGNQILFRENSMMRLVLFRKSQEITTELSVKTNDKLEIQSFDFSMKSLEANISMKGERFQDRLRMTVNQAGALQTKDITLQEPTLVSATIRPYVLMRGLTSKPSKHSGFLLEPSALTTIPLELSVQSLNPQTWSLHVNYLAQVLKSEISKSGALLKETSDLAGMPLEARPVTEPEYRGLLIEGTTRDLVEVAKVPFPEIPNAKNLKVFSVRLSGADMSGFQLNRNRQSFVGDRLKVQVEAAKIEGTNVQSLAGSKDFERYLQGDASIPVHDAQIQRKAREIIGTESNLWKRAQLIHKFVYENVQKVPTVSVPNGLEVLKTMRGDCNEHAVLYTSLARAVGIPTRILVGLVYGDRFYGDPGFYYHAWVEVYTGKEWIAIDPTWNQIPADATHLAFVEGGLDQQVQVTSLMGRIRLAPVQ